MERPSKRMRMSLPAPHPVAELLDDAFRAFFLKMEAKKRPILPLQPFNAVEELKQLNEEVDSIATHSDASVYADLPYDLQGLVRQFTPHLASLLVEDATYEWKELQFVRRHWPHAEECRLRTAHQVRDSNVRVARFDWLQDRGNHGAWRRSDVSSADIMGNDPYDPHMPTGPWDYF